MDRIDRKILALYQNDTRRIAESIGAEVGLSAAGVQRRLKRLRASGTISAEVALLNAAAVDLPIACVVAVAMTGRAAPQRNLEKFKRDMKTAPEVQQCYHVTGTTDFVLIVTAASMEAYGEFARLWFQSNENVTRYETHVVLDKVKLGLSLPL